MSSKSKRPKLGEGFDKLPAERRARTLKALVTGETGLVGPDGKPVSVIPAMRTKVLNKLISDTIRPRDKTRYILELKTKHPALSAKELFARADKGVIGPMRFHTFENKLSKE